VEALTLECLPPDKPATYQIRELRQTLDLACLVINNALVLALDSTKMCSLEFTQAVPNALPQTLAQQQLREESEVILERVCHRRDLETDLV